jgi:hypothetical protein
LRSISSLSRNMTTSELMAQAWGLESAAARFAAALAGGYSRGRFVAVSDCERKRLGAQDAFAIGDLAQLASA